MKNLLGFFIKELLYAACVMTQAKSTSNEDPKSSLKVDLGFECY